MKVLFAVDGSEGSFEAIAQVGQLLQHGAHQAALYCSAPSIRRGSRSADPAVLARAKQGLVDAVVEEARLRLPEALRAAATVITTTDDPRTAIVTTGESWGAELLVVGARGLSTFERLLLGSVSRAVVHTSRIPVWVARGPAKPQGMNVLLACENPEQGRRPLELLRALAWPAGSTCHTLTVVASMFAGRVPDWLQQQARSPDVEAMVQAWARERDEDLRSTRSAMTEFAASLPANCRHGEPTVAEGEPASMILAAIKNEQVDVVVLGHYRKNWLTSTLLGRTSEAVLNYAPCSVVVVPHQEQA